MKELQSISLHVPIHVSRRITGYFGLAGLFFLLSFITIYLVHRVFSQGQVHLDPHLLSLPVIGGLAVLLILYFVADGLRLYCVIRAMGFHIAFRYVFKLVFINIFVSNVTPLATGGGVVQVYFLQKRGMPIGDATAATTIRTILAVLILFTLTPVLIWSEPNLFRLFYHRNLLYIVALFSSGYLAVFFVVLFRIRMIKRWVFRGLYLLNVLKIISTKRFRTLFLKISRELGLFSDGFRRYIKGGPGWVALSFVFTTLFLVLLFSFSVLLLRALGYQVAALTVLAFQVVVTFFMYFAPTPGATGVAEGGYGLLFAQLVQKQDITLLTLSWRFLTIYVGVIIGILIVYKEILSGKKAARK